MLIIHYKFENKRESSATAINLFIILNLRKSKSKHLNKQYCTFFVLFYGFNVVVVSWKALHCTQGWWHFTTCFLQKKFKKRKLKSRQPDSLTAPAWMLWSKATSVDTTPSLPVKSREMICFGKGRKRRGWRKDHLKSALMYLWLMVEIFNSAM